MRATVLLLLIASTSSVHPSFPRLLCRKSSRTPQRTHDTRHRGRPMTSVPHTSTMSCLIPLVCLKGLYTSSCSAQSSCQALIRARLPSSRVVTTRILRVMPRLAASLPEPDLPSAAGA
jgi:hypothetical protein